jgi:hypothetical protein
MLVSTTLPLRRRGWPSAGGDSSWPLDVPRSHLPSGSRSFDQVLSRRLLAQPSLPTFHHRRFQSVPNTFPAVPSLLSDNLVPRFHLLPLPQVGYNPHSHPRFRSTDSLRDARRTKFVPLAPTPVVGTPGKVTYSLYPAAPKTPTAMMLLTSP